MDSSAFREELEHILIKKLISKTLSEKCLSMYKRYFTMWSQSSQILSEEAFLEKIKTLHGHIFKAVKMETNMDITPVCQENVTKFLHEELKCFWEVLPLNWSFQDMELAVSAQNRVLDMMEADLRETEVKEEETKNIRKDEAKENNKKEADENCRKEADENCRKEADENCRKEAEENTIKKSELNDDILKQTMSSCQSNIFNESFKKQLVQVYRRYLVMWKIGKVTYTVEQLQKALSIGHKEVLRRTKVETNYDVTSPMQDKVLHFMASRFADYYRTLPCTLEQETMTEILNGILNIMEKDIHNQILAAEMKAQEQVSCEEPKSNQNDVPVVEGLIGTSRFYSSYRNGVLAVMVALAVICGIWFVFLHGRQLFQLAITKDSTDYSDFVLPTEVPLPDRLKDLQKKIVNCVMEQELKSSENFSLVCQATGDFYSSLYDYIHQKDVFTQLILAREMLQKEESAKLSKFFPEMKHINFWIIIRQMEYLELLPKDEDIHYVNLPFQSWLEYELEKMIGLLDVFDYLHRNIFKNLSNCLEHDSLFLMSKSLEIELTAEESMAFENMDVSHKRLGTMVVIVQQRIEQWNVLMKNQESLNCTGKSAMNFPREESNSVISNSYFCFLAFSLIIYLFQQKENNVLLVFGLLLRKIVMNFVFVYFACVLCAIAIL